MKKLKLLFAVLILSTVSVFAYSYLNTDKATCTGSAKCNACKNCKYCKHCAKNGGTCGVCK